MEILYKEVEERLLRACRTLRALPDRDRPPNVKSYWPATADDPDLAYGYAEVAMPRFRPSPAAVSDMLPALEWTRGMPKREFKYIWWRSLGFSFGWMATRTGRSDETCRRYYIEAVRNAWYKANQLAAVS